MADNWLIFENGKWREAGPDSATPATRFSDLWRHYSNLIDYARVALCLLAAATLAGRMPLTTAVLLLSSTLLDWLDGPVARAYNQCTIFGSGVDWLADILAQFVTLAWLGSLASRASPSNWRPASSISPPRRLDAIRCSNGAAASEKFWTGRCPLVRTLHSVRRSGWHIRCSSPPAVWI